MRPRQYILAMNTLCGDVVHTNMGCGDALQLDDVNSECLEKGCEFHKCNSCTRLKDAYKTHHPLHAQHPLIVHLNNDKSKSVCSFYYSCGLGQTDFYSILLAPHVLQRKTIYLTNTSLNVSFMMVMIIMEIIICHLIQFQQLRQ